MPSKSTMIDVNKDFNTLIPRVQKMINNIKINPNIIIVNPPLDFIYPTKGKAIRARLEAQAIIDKMKPVFDSLDMHRDVTYPTHCQL